MTPEKIGSTLARISRIVFVLFGILGIAIMLIGIVQDDLMLVAAGLLMTVVTPATLTVAKRHTAATPPANE
jgi:hypothetical protein